MMALPMTPQSRLLPEHNADVLIVAPDLSCRIDPPTPPPARPRRQAKLAAGQTVEARRGRP